MFHLSLFFTQGMSLQAWHQVGMLNRELAIYRAMQERGVSVSLITYGKRDLQYQSVLNEFVVRTKRFMPITRIYSAMIPIMHASALTQTDIIKTNQMLGGMEALRAAQLFRKPLIARQGYMWSAQLASQYHNDWTHPDVKHALKVEANVWERANHIIVSSNEMRESILERMPHVAEWTTVIPNYVDTDIFYPTDSPKQYDLIFVGRLEEQKNIFALLDAVKMTTDVSLLIIGAGSQQKEVVSLIQNEDRITYIERVPNHELAQLFNQSRAFILPSYYEGLPKVLLEAMACGLPVIGTDVRGTREIIDHKANGILANTDADSLREAIMTTLNNTVLQAQLGKSALETILNRYTLAQIVDQELDIVYKLTQT